MFAVARCQAADSPCCLLLLLASSPYISLYGASQSRGWQKLRLRRKKYN